MSRQVTHDGQGTLIVRFAFDRRLVEVVKGLPNRRWIAAERYWSVPDTDVVLLVDALAGSHFRFDEATREAYRRMGGRASLAVTAPVAAAPAADSPLQRGLFDTAQDDAPPQPDAALAPAEFTVAELNESVRRVLESALTNRAGLPMEPMNKAR